MPTSQRFTPADSLHVFHVQGVYNLPNCGTDDDDPKDQPTAACLAVQTVVAHGAYLPYLRDHVVQAQYFKVRGPLLSMPSPPPLPLPAPPVDPSQVCYSCRARGCGVKVALGYAIPY